MHQTRSQAIGREGERWFQSILPSTWIYQHPSEDIGIDGVVVITDNDDMRGVEFRVQIKSSERWSLVNGHLVVREVSRDAVRYWASGLTPTLLVLYDQKHKHGWAAFVFDLVGDPASLLAATTKTFILRCPASSMLNRDGWQRVKDSIRIFYERFLSAFRSAHSASIRLSVIHTLRQSLKSLQMVHFAPPPSTYYDSLGPTLLQTLGIEM